MWILFYLFAGPDAIRPHTERWGLCLIVPGTLLLARGVAAWIDSPPPTRGIAIAAASADGARVMIVSQQWWTYWPLAYLARGETRVSAGMDLAAEQSRPAFVEAAFGGRLFFVEFADSPELSDDKAWIARHGRLVATSAVQNAAGADLLEILQVTTTR